MAILAFNQVTFTDKDHTILKEISFSIEQGGFVTIVGPSGGGKSTLLKLASYLISPSSGTIHFQGKPLDTFNPITLRQEISTVFKRLIFLEKRLRTICSSLFHCERKPSISLW